MYSAQLPSYIFVSTRPLGLAPPNHCQWWPAAGGTHTTHWWGGGGKAHRGPKSGGERKYKEGSSGSSDRSDRSNTDLFLDLFCGLSSSMVPTASSWEAMEANSLQVGMSCSYTCSSGRTLRPLFCQFLLLLLLHILAIIQSLHLNNWHHVLSRLPW